MLAEVSLLRMEQSEVSITPLNQIALYIVGGILFVGLALLTSRLIRPNRPNPQKLTSYESGETPQGLAWVQFNIRFYVLALVFLLFEVEIVFLFPWSTILSDTTLNAETNGSWSWFAFVEMLIFILILVLGLVYVWKKGFLDWVKSTPDIPDYKSPVPSELYRKINDKYKSVSPKDNFES
jgi:NADH-quinone oxidoreductase subunit A